MFFYYYRNEEKVERRPKQKSVNNLKDIRLLYKPYCPKILKDNHGFKYNLSEESIFGNLHYSMNQNILKGKSFDYQSISKDKHFNYIKNIQKPLKLIPILRYKPA